MKIINKKTTRIIKILLAIKTFISLCFIIFCIYLFIDKGFVESPFLPIILSLGVVLFVTYIINKIKRYYSKNSPIFFKIIDNKISIIMVDKKNNIDFKIEELKSIKLYQKELKFDLILRFKDGDQKIFKFIDPEIIEYFKKKAIENRIKIIE